MFQAISPIVRPVAIGTAKLAVTTAKVVGQSLAGVALGGGLLLTMGHLGDRACKARAARRLRKQAALDAQTDAVIARMIARGDVILNPTLIPA